jgi:CRISPR-associated protein (TIGR02584 family)
MKNILVCVSGLTPQIITESLYCLSVKEKIPIHEVYVITTARGKDVILGKDKHPATPKSSLKNEIEELCKTYKLNPPSFENNSNHIIVAREESVELPDIRSDVHNKLFPNKVNDFIRLKSHEKETVIYAVISGGRKSMSVHLSFALSLFGRENDKLLHVLTSEEHEFKGFYPKNKKEHKSLELSEIPFVRLRSLISSEFADKKLLSKNYIDIVNFAQKQLKIVTAQSKLFIDIPSAQLIFNSSKIKLEPLEFALYFSFVDRIVSSKNTSIPIQTINSAEFGATVASFISEYFPHYYFNESIKRPWWKFGFEPESFRSKRSKINDKISSILDDPDMFDMFKIDSIKKYFETSYCVKADKNKFKINF